MTKKDTSETNETSKKSEKGEWGELMRTATFAVLLALVIRTFLFEPFNIPSGSMLPTLKVGDYLFVSKYSYGYSRYSFPFGLGGFDGRVWVDKPERGDVVVFKLPTDTSIDYIKRVIGLPGDKIQVTNGRLYINGELADREDMGLSEYESEYGSVIKISEFAETLPEGRIHLIYEEGDANPLDNTQVFTVPDGNYFMMGDNRDNSRDSRVADAVGFVPFENFVGRAEFIFFSTNGKSKFYEVWKWPFTIRYNRLFKTIS